MTSEFEEIGHSGGKITFKIRTNEKGMRSSQVVFSHCRPVPVVMTAVYALPPGLPVAPMKIGGEGQQWDSPPFPGCVPVFISSDSQGKFGHNCPQCNGYWRSGPWPNLCPYVLLVCQAMNFFQKLNKDICSITAKC
ncbi:MAG: hypothetical protein ACYDIC_14825 [Desulfobaccales bacterium]